MSAIKEIRQNGRIPYEGTCRGCGKEMLKTLPQKTEFVAVNEQRWRCTCGTINSLEKASET